MRINLSQEQQEFLRLLLAEERERAQDHLDWLASPQAADEPDKDRQIAEMERAVATTKAILALLGGAS